MKIKSSFFHHYLDKDRPFSSREKSLPKFSRPLLSLICISIVFVPSPSLCHIPFPSILSYSAGQDRMNQTTVNSEEGCLSNVRRQWISATYRKDQGQVACGKTAHLCEQHLPLWDTFIPFHTQGPLFYLQHDSFESFILSTLKIWNILRNMQMCLRNCPFPTP